MTKIGWTNETWNPTVGCSKISAGCANCYAANTAKSPRLQQFSQYQKVKDWDGTIEFVESQLLKPLSWKSPKKVFVCSMSDIFHANVKDEWLDKIFAVIAIASQHTFQVLTKRPERMQEYLSDPLTVDRIEEAGYEFTHNMDCLNNWPLPNVWLGVSVENQKVANDRIPKLLKSPATIRFLSCEPLLEQLNIEKWLYEDPEGGYPGIDWVILGGESGSGARPCAIEWMQWLIQQCACAQTKVFVKQLGTNPVVEHPYIAGVAIGYSSFPKSDRTGLNIEDYPPALRIREFPG